MRLTHRITSLLAALLVLGALPAVAAHTQARLILDATTARPGDTVMAGVHLQMDPGWHTYWRNPGQEGGLPTTITWEPTPGVTPGNIQWPVPEKFKMADPTIGIQPSAETVNYTYSHEVVLLVPLQIAKDAKPGPITLKAKVSWLECETKCIPGRANLEASLEIGSENQPSPDKPLLEAWQKKLPKKGDGLAARAWWAGSPSGTTRSLNIEWTAPATTKEPDFFPDKSDDFEIDPRLKKVDGAPGTIRLVAQVTKSGDNWPKQISGLLVHSDGAYEVTLPVADSGNAAAAPAPTRATPPAPTRFITPNVPPLWKLLSFALLGGLILNIMPCVLPVIALKILGFVNEAKSEPGRIRKFGLLYTFGVLASFFVLAVLFIGLQKAGHAVGWGLQFKNPYFIMAMCLLVALISLNLFGVFEINPGAGTLNAASTLAGKRGTAGAFFNGLFATLLATSCSAPVLAAAIGPALLSPPLTIVLIMLTVGLGLSLPYLVLSWNPAWVRFVPKPGQWMNRFKIAMGFPMLAATVWLCGLLRIHYGDRAWSFAMFLAFVAVAAWIYGEFVQRGSSRRPVALLIAAVLLLFGYFYTLERGMGWRHPITEAAKAEQEKNGTQSVSSLSPAGVPWKPWSPEAVAAAREAGLPVVVDFTATWCPTCNTIVKPSFESESVQKKLKEINAVALVADYSLQPKSITDELRRFQRAAVPLVVIYPRDASAPPMVFDLVTPGTLLEALEKAAGK